MNARSQIHDDLLRKLAEAAGPCITIVLPEVGGTQFEVSKKRALQKVRKALEEFEADAAALLEPLQQLTQPSPNRTLVVFRSPDLFEQKTIEEARDETVTVDSQFGVREWLTLKDSDRNFYLLALSLKRTRLLKCNSHSAEEVELPKGTPVSLDEALQLDTPDHRLQNMDSAGPSVGNMKGVVFGTSSDEEAKDEYVRHFFLKLDRAVKAALNHSDAPLVVAAVDHELAEYRRINTYAHLVDPGVTGAPDGLKGGELHKRALELLNLQVPEPSRKFLENYDKLVGTGHASTHAQEIVKAAYDGRVAQLLIQPDAQYQGTYDGIRRRVKRQRDPVDPQRDLLNDAAIETLRHGGAVYSLSSDKMPNGIPVAAVFRYAAPETAPASMETSPETGVRN
ncbi:MAG TPA: hypothetical protein VM120_23735 [Bryobacteraceae bacterium]|nr:hypothetical protein [Bryobacteraceae bacterium]